MGKKFDVVYEDFTGGHYMGSSQATMARNTWTGPNVICTADEGFLMADGGWLKQATPTATPTTPVELTPPTMHVASIFSDPLTYNGRSYFGSSADAVVRAAEPFSNYVSALATLPAVPAPLAEVSLLANRLAFVPSTGASSLYLVTDIGGVTTVTTTANFGLGTWWWNSFAFGVAINSSLLYFSAPNDPTSWTATDYISIGESGRPITAVMPTADALYVAKSDGWWVITGVPGRTASLRRLSRTGLVGQNAAAETRQGIMFRAPRSPVVNVLRGTQVDQFAALPYGQYVSHIVPSGEHTLVQAPGPTLGDPAHLYLWSDSQRRWRHKPYPLPATQDATLGIEWWPVADPDVNSGYVNVISAERYDTTAENALYGWVAPRDPIEPQAFYGRFDTATATLAEYTANDPFRVHELVVEVDFGQPAVQTYPRSITGSVIAAAPPDLDPTFSVNGLDPVLHQSTQFTKTWSTATNTRRGHRQTVRFGVNDAATETYAAAPVVSMTGVKVRRVIMRCEAIR